MSTAEATPVKYTIGMLKGAPSQSELDDILGETCEWIGQWPSNDQVSRGIILPPAVQNSLVAIIQRAEVISEGRAGSRQAGERMTECTKASARATAWLLASIVRLVHKYLNDDLKWLLDVEYAENEARVLATEAASTFDVTRGVAWYQWFMKLLRTNVSRLVSPDSFPSATSSLPESWLRVGRRLRMLDGENDLDAAVATLRRELLGGLREDDEGYERKLARAIRGGQWGALDHAQAVMEATEPAHSLNATVIEDGDELVDLVQASSLICASDTRELPEGLVGMLTADTEAIGTAIGVLTLLGVDAGDSEVAAAGWHDVHFDENGEWSHVIGKATLGQIAGGVGVQKSTLRLAVNDAKTRAVDPLAWWSYLSPLAVVDEVVETVEGSPLLAALARREGRA